ncbi:beta-galactosidase [Ktedonosporobacter rubrisoli]|uniref:Beta-galactosidase n=1 Tax=Ktedonosporobacter rubrisoli TaxID=2509675 RepID=A0A4P6JN24_KTERU|nr:sugar-binding domain-containing protein [Ktedonosporobacter rubrisoli]QBD76470.1 beta-galactosidase [Ktedonosporobacter rubrisoli]
MALPRPEYPRPQFERSRWLCLNGEWQFEIDAGDSGLERGLLQRELQDRIMVPFCPESELSGIGNTDFMPAVWYRRRVTIPAEWSGQRVQLHFQAVDYDATVWVNGQELGRHRGGFTPFSVELPGGLAGSEVTIVVRARDDARPAQARGKQSQRYDNYSCFYTRTTGIWQTVWLEPVPEVALRRPRITPDVANGMFHLVQPLDGRRAGLVVQATLRDSEGTVCVARCSTDHDLSPQLDLPIPAERRQLWSPQNPHLYDLDIQLLDGETLIDQASSYAGLRSVAINGKAITINGETIFQRLVLDQGYYPDGIMTAPSDEALRHDIELSIAAGFNGARLHQKVFEERFLYHADRIGYLVWGEFPDWGSGGYGPVTDHQQPGVSYVAQWLEAIERDYSHPSIIGWCALNETWQVLTDKITALDDATRAMFLAIKLFDPTRPVLDASGYSHRVPESDVYDSHDYEQDPALFTDHYAQLEDGKPYINDHDGKPISIAYRGQPFFVSEFGGIWWSAEREPGDTSWGYGVAVRSLEEFYQRFEGLCKALLDHPAMFGYCYTQLTDVYQEQNGIYAFDRSSKFDLERLRAVQTRQAAIEK